MTNQLTGDPVCVMLGSEMEARMNWNDSPYRRPLRASTAGLYDTVWRKIVDAAAAAGRSEVSPDDVRTHLAGLAQLNPATYNRHVAVIRAVAKAMKRPELSDGLERMPEDPVSRRALTPQEVNRLLSVADGEMRGLLMVGVYTGMRLGDCATLDWSEVDAASWMICRRPSKARRANKRIRVPIHPEIRRVFESRPVGAVSGPVFPETAILYTSANGRANLSKRVSTVFRRAGIVDHIDRPGVRSASIVGFHALRHTFVSMCRQAGAPVAVVQGIVGHSSPAVTAIYTHVSDDAARDVLGRMPAFASV